MLATKPSTGRSGLRAGVMQRNCVQPCRQIKFSRAVGISRIVCQVGTEEPLSTTAAPAIPSPPPTAPIAVPQYAPPSYYAPVDAYNTQTAGGALPPQGQNQRQEYYYAMPPPGYMPYPPPPAAEASSSGLPWFVWLGAGILLTKGIDVVQGIMKKGPQGFMTEMAMKQAMNAMMSQQGGSGAASPFGAPGASPFGAPGASPFGGAGSPFGAPPGGSPFGAPGASPFGSGFPTPPSASKTVDVNPSAAAPPSAPASTASSAASDKGGKFKQRINSEGRTIPDPPKREATSEKPLDVVEPVVKEPAAGASQASSSSKPTAGFFTDVNPDEAAANASRNAGASSSGAGATNGAAAGGAAGGEANMMSQLMEQMLRNPEMQKMLYPYLPENLRNPQSIEWMLSNPEVRAQMEQMFANQNMSVSPQMMEMMKGMDLNSDKVNKQFADLGLKPEDVISKVMSNPDLAMGFQNPRVQQAIMDISQNPMNIVKYQTDPEVMKVLEKVNEIFAPNMR